ncbi:MAG: TlpA disulfide reductase family protein [Halieaceae bacterium]|nr:TlpA disulfide reductase family protein [Halieaceae bacterium]
MELKTAPELQTTHWLNAPQEITLASLRGKIVMLEAFQMLCPGCVSHGLPQAQRVSQAFSPDDVAVIGLHTVFEHHLAQGTKEALEAFLHEYKINFPVGIDTPTAAGGTPRTMTEYQMQGTPTLILIDRQGRLRKQTFGMEQDLVLGAEIMSLLKEE